MGFVADPASAAADATPATGGFVPDKSAAGEQPGKLGPWASSIARPIAGGVISAATFIPDFATSLVNVVANAGEKALGVKHGQEAVQPSTYFQGLLDEHTTAPDTLGRKVAEGVSSTVISGGRSLGALGTNLIERGGKALANLVGHAEENGLTRVTSAAAEQAHNAGIKLSPSYVGGKVSKSVQAAAGGGKVDAVISEQNVSRIDSLAKTSIGLHPEEEMSDLNLDKLRKENFAKYDSLAATGAMKPDPVYETAVAATGGRFAQRSTGFGGGYRYESIAKEKANYISSVGNPVTAQDAIDEVRALRATSRSNLKVYDPEKNALGLVQRQIADAIDARLDRHAQSIVKEGLANAKGAGRAGAGAGTAVTRPGTILPGGGGATPAAAGATGSGPPKDAMSAARALFTPDAYKGYVAARENLAKIATVEDALDPGGHIIAESLARAQANGVKFSGGLKVIADTATHFSKSVKSVAKTGTQGLWSPLDFLVGGAGIIAHNPKSAVMIVARPVARAALGTKTVQREMLGKQTPIGTVVKAGVRGTIIKGSEAAQESDDKKDDEE